MRTGRGPAASGRRRSSTGSITIPLLLLPVHPEQLAVGSTVRLLYGEPREGCSRLEMVHPRIKSGKAAETELPKALTHVYPQAKASLAA